MCRLRAGRISQRLGKTRNKTARLYFGRIGLCALALLLSAVLILRFGAKDDSLPDFVPVSGVVTDGYGLRFSPKIAFHYGVDIAAPIGTSVCAAGAGTVQVGFDGEFGNYVFVTHNASLASKYAHLESVLVSDGDTVKKGEPLGTVGVTGNTTGAHLHFEIWENGARADPKKYLRNYLN